MEIKDEIPGQVRVLTVDFRFENNSLVINVNNVNVPLIVKIMLP